MNDTIKVFNCLANLSQVINQFGASKILTSKEAINLSLPILIDALVILTERRNRVFSSVTYAARNSNPCNLRVSSYLGQGFFGWTSPQSIIVWHRVTSRFPHSADTSGDGENTGIFVITMASGNSTKYSMVSSTIHAATSTTSRGLEPCVSMTADTDKRRAAKDEYVGVEWSRPSLRGYTRSKSSVLKTS